jgi:A/G-specific adenine glycosylase
MLQQTTTVHAAPYFKSFVARWPTVRDLAAAVDGDVMAAWAGLGYYARARNLLACARAVTDDYDGEFPSDEEALRALPGLGPYTAAAVAAIAFDQPANVVDGNVERVMARLFAVESPLPGAKPELKRLAATLVRPDRAGDWAQALMDLGATVCKPRSPACDRCPLQADCRAFASGDPQVWPRRDPKAIRPRRHGAVYVVLSSTQVGLTRRPPKGLLGGMLALPTTDWRGEPWTLADALSAAPGPGAWRLVGTVTHGFTHFELELAVFVVIRAWDSADLIWTPIGEALHAMPTVFRKALRLVGDGR